MGDAQFGGEFTQAYLTRRVEVAFSKGEDEGFSLFVGEAELLDALGPLGQRVGSDDVNGDVLVYTVVGPCLDA
ncbi:hypothetical protein VB779_23020 [Haloarculaceae archaeon H-GB11]|nr:hypothetical protein [Haloarculaceae archaeon H-GB11]